MNNEEVKFNILTLYFADECEIAGLSNVDAISKGTLTLIQAKHGANMPIMEILASLAAIASFIDSTISIIEAWIKVRSKDTLTSGKEEVSKIVESSITPPPGIDAHTLNQIYSYILKKAQEEHNDGNEK